MKPILTPENVQEIFERQANIGFKEHQEISIDTFIKCATEFFENFKFQNFNVFINEDYLVFDYGVYPRENEFGNYFAISIARHFAQDNLINKFHYKFCFTLYFYDISLLKIGLFKLDNKKFDTTRKWIREIKKSDGYKSTKNSRADLYNVELTDAFTSARVCN